jgi:hypothetical protein
VTVLKRKRKRFSKRPPDGPFGANAAWIHGGCGTPEYNAYAAAKTLCANPKNPRWAQYGGRGIEFRFPCLPRFSSIWAGAPREGSCAASTAKVTSRSATYVGRGAKAQKFIDPVAKLEQPPVAIPNITRRAYAERATKPHRKSVHVGWHTTPLTMFQRPAKLQRASIRVAILTARTTHLGSVLPAIESRRRAVQ